nr:MAG TPA: hypothetical protein [Caudoviricetes sp.]
MKKNKIKDIVLVTVSVYFFLSAIVCMFIYALTGYADHTLIIKMFVNMCLALGTILPSDF